MTFTDNRDPEGRLVPAAGDVDSVSKDNKAAWKQAIAVQSKRAARITGVGGLIVLVSFVWSYVEIQTTTKKLNQVETRIAQDTVTASDLENQIADLTKKKQALTDLANGVSKPELAKTLKSNPAVTAVIARVRIVVPDNLEMAASRKTVTELGAAGLIVEGVSQIKAQDDPAETEIRYFHTGDERRSDLGSIKTALKQLGMETVVRSSTITVDGQHTRPGYYEVWLSSNFDIPLSWMTNTELRESILSFKKRTLTKYRPYWDLQDQVASLNNRMTDPFVDRAVIEKSRDSVQKTVLNMNESILKHDIPRANSYRTEVIRRLGSGNIGGQDFATSPQAQAINTFLGNMRYFEDLVKNLPE